MHQPPPARGPQGQPPPPYGPPSYGPPSYGPASPYGPAPAGRRPAAHPGPYAQQPGSHPQAPGQQPRLPSPYPQPPNQHPPGQQPGYQRPSRQQQPGQWPPPAPGAAEPPQRAKPKWHSRLLYVLALVVLVPLTIGFEYWVELGNTPGSLILNDPIVVEKGKKYAYEGATWKLELAQVAPPAPGVEIPSDVKLVYAVLAVTPDNAKASKRLTNCRLEASDGDGRIWASNTTLADLAALDDPMTGCQARKGEFGLGPIPAGKTQRILATYLVPKSEVSNLRVRVVVDMETRPLELSS